MSEYENIDIALDNLYNIMLDCLKAENVKDGLLEDVENITNNYYNEKSLDEPLIWVTQHPLRVERSADISKTMELVVPFEFDSGYYHTDLDTAYYESMNLTSRVILSILKNWQKKEAEHSDRRFIKRIMLDTFTPVGYVNVNAKSDRLMVSGVILNVVIIINWLMCIKDY